MDEEPPTEMASPTAMRELVHYFETHGRRLDQQDTAADGSTSQPGQQISNFVSCIRFSGIPILPPVMTSSRRDEVRQDRHNAVFKEKRLRVRQSRQQLMQVANSLVENAEAGCSSETRAMRTAPAVPASSSSSSSRLALERPLILKPVVTSAWASVSASSSTTTSTHSEDSASAIAPSSLANTFATAEAAHEEFGLHTLDSVCSDFMSLEETLPTDFNGVPLTSIKQQKISHDLLRLSKVLKVRDLNSTGGSDISDLPLSEYAGQQSALEERGKSGKTSALDNVSNSFCHDSQDTVVEASSDHVLENNAAENNTSGFLDNSTDGSPAELSSQNLSATGSASTSGMSSANTTATTDSHRSSRSSPRSLKNNTVHFASFVTEYIDTSASLSSENITVVKKKLPGDKLAKDRADALADSVQVNKQTSQDLLSNVSLSEPDFSPSLTPPSSLFPSLPFQSYVKTDPSSSDKENDSGQSNKLSGRRDDLTAPSESGECPKSGRGSSVSDSQGSNKSDATATTSESSTSTLIEDVAAIASASQDSITALPLNIVEGEDEAKAHRDNHKQSSASVPPHKPKKLPPEPPQESYQQHSAKQKKLTEDKGSGGNKKDSGDSLKGHIRRGSYTLIEPSPALLRAQGVSRRDESNQDKTGGGEGKHADGVDRSKPLNIPVQATVPSDPEAAGKAEHINKYLSQVQLHNSEDLTASQLSTELSQSDLVAAAATSGQVQNSLSMVGQSMSSSHRGLGPAGAVGGGVDSQVLTKFQSLRQNLLEQQQQDLEELFILQRREQMMLQGEIEEHQRRMKEQQEFLVSNAPENIKLPSQKHDGELSPDYNAGGGGGSTQVKQFTFPSHPKESHHTAHLQGSGAAASRVPQGPPLLLNTSAASSSPKVKRLVLRSPVKFHPGRRPSGHVIVPLEAYEPEMKVKFDKLTAAAKGFLCRCLLQSDKVQELVKTIKDTREFAFSFQSETPIRHGNFSNQDRTLLERIVAQLQAALLDVHEIFFDTPVAEQMSLIEQTRINSREKRLKSSTDEVVRNSAPRISTATLKAQERRRRAQEAESIVFGASLTRPRTAPSSTNSPRSQASVDLSGPLKRHYHFLMSRARQAAHQSHHHHASGPRADSSRLDMERPQTAPERSSSGRVKKTAALFTQGAVSTHSTADSGQGKLNIRPKASQQPGSQSGATGKSSKAAAASSKSTKSWR